MTGKSIIIGNKSELHPSITPFFGGCFFYFFVIPLPEWKCVWKTKRGHHACVPVSHNIRIGKFAEKGRLNDQNIEQIKKTFFSCQLCEFIFLASCPDIYENLWNQLGAHDVNCNDSGGQNIMLFRPITNTKSQRYIKETNTVEKAWTVL